MDEEVLILAGITNRAEDQTKSILKPPTLGAPEEAGTATAAAETSKPTKKTPAAKKSTGKKRKAFNTQTPRNQRLRPRSSSTPKTKSSDLVDALLEIAGEPQEKSQDNMTTTSQSAGRAPEDPMDKFKEYMDMQFSSLRGEVGTIRNDVAQSVQELSTRVAANSSNIDQLRREFGTEIEKKVADAVGKEIRKMGAGRRMSVGMEESNHEQSNYWRSRRSIRCWPIVGPENDLWGLTGDFFEKILGIPPSSLPQDSVETIRRLGNRRTKKPARIQNEILVTFRDVATRDMVVSYAPNLASYKNSDSPPGIRIDFPDHLKGAFTTLETYGHKLRTRFGPTLKRGIKFDDTIHSLYIDVCFPNDSKWTKISLEVAAAEVAREREKDDEILKKRIDGFLASDETQSTATCPPTPLTHTTQTSAAAARLALPQSATLQQFNGQRRPPARWGGSHH